MKPIFLIGFMGSGKSSIGRELADILHLSFIDADSYIEEKCKKTIPELFKEMGEDGFRALEHNDLMDLLVMEDCVIATGGGMPCFYDNMTLMNENGKTIYLEVSVEELVHRLYYKGNKRPLLQDKNQEELKSYIEESLSQRGKFYRQAQLTLPADDSVAAASRIALLLQF